MRSYANVSDSISYVTINYSPLFFTELTEIYQRTVNLVARECSAAPGIVPPPNAGQQTQTGQTARRIWESVRVMMSVATTTSVWRDCAEGGESYRTRPRMREKFAVWHYVLLSPKPKRQSFIDY